MGMACSLIASLIVSLLCRILLLPSLSFLREAGAIPSISKIYDMSRDSRLQPDSPEILEMGQAAVELMAEYYAYLDERRIYPETTSRRIRELLDCELPMTGIPFAEILRDFESVILPGSRHNAHPRCLGYVTSPGTPVAAIADLLTSTLNANLTSWRSAPAPAEVERICIDWIKQILGYPSEAAGLFLSGGSMANLCGMAAARRSKAPFDVARLGTSNQRMTAYASEQAHHSISKAAAILGIGSDNVRMIRTDDRFRIDVDDLQRRIESDTASGDLPFLIVATAGTVNTGAVDPIRVIAGIAKHHKLWLHVDGAYGGFAALAPSARSLFDGIDEADSTALDPHKWLYLPVDCGCILYKDPDSARATFGHDAEYTRVLDCGKEEAFAFWDYGPELSRRFRALKVWILLRHVGIEALSQAVEGNLACAKRLEGLVESSDDLEMLAPVELSIFCFRYVGGAACDKQRPYENEAFDHLNERILVQLQKDGNSYLSNTRVRGRFALRGCITNYRTAEKDMEILLEDVRGAARKVGA